MDSTTPIWALLLAFFCPPLIYTNLIIFRSVPSARAQSLAPAHFSLPSHLATSYVSSLERALFPFSGGNVLEVGGGCTAFSLSLYAIFLLFRPWLWRRATPLSLCTVCGNLSLGLSQEPLYFLLCVLPLTAGSQRRSPHRRTLSSMWTAASMERALLGE